MPTRYIGDGYWEIASRQMSIVTRSEQQRFKDAKVTVIGCGGIGGETIEMLARMGIGELVLVDKDAFDLSNLNRQTLATISDLGLDKSSVAAEKVRLINPYVKTTIFNEHVDQNNIEVYYFRGTHHRGRKLICHSSNLSPYSHLYHLV